jgi:hypothetical protein
MFTEKHAACPDLTRDPNFLRSTSILRSDRTKTDA